MSSLLLFVVSLFSLNLFATEIPMIDVVAEAQPNSTGYIDLAVANDSTFLGLAFKAENEVENVTIQDLNKKKSTIIKQGPVDIISVSAKSSSSNSMLLSIHYLYQFKLINSIYKVKQLKMYYVSPTNLYETVDVDTNKVVTHAYGYSHFVNGDVKGISRIETW